LRRVTDVTKYAIAIALIGTAILPVSVCASSDVDLAEAKQCFRCHSIEADRTLRSPSFQSIARKYGGQDATGAQRAKLSQTIRKGTPEKGGYHWGRMAMPSPDLRPVISDAEAARLTHWILNLR